MIYQTVNELDFIEAFDKAGRPDQFTIGARKTLFDWYNDLSACEDIELDPIGICCDWGEFTGRELIREFGHAVDLPDAPDEDTIQEVMIQALEQDGILLVVEHPGEVKTFLYCEG